MKKNSIILDGQELFFRANDYLRLPDNTIYVMACNFPVANVELNIPRKNNDVINWTNPHNWRSNSELVIDGKRVSLANICQWLSAQEHNEDLFQALGIEYDEEYRKVKNLYEMVTRLSEILMAPHIGESTSKHIKINIKL